MIVRKGEHKTHCGKCGLSLSGDNLRGGKVGGGCRACFRLRTGWKGGSRNGKKTHCLRGHPLSGDNLYTDPSGQRHCRTCQRERQRVWRASLGYHEYQRKYSVDPEHRAERRARDRKRRADPKYREQERKYHREYARKYRARQRELKYGLVEGAYDKIFRDQNGVCAICGKPETRRLRGKLTNLSVDHDHETGEVRGLLCSRCNFGLGQIGDVLEGALAYIASGRVGVDTENGK